MSKNKKKNETKQKPAVRDLAAKKDPKAGLVTGAGPGAVFGPQ